MSVETRSKVKLSKKLPPPAKGGLALIMSNALKGDLERLLEASDDHSLTLGLGRTAYTTSASIQLSKIGLETATMKEAFEAGPEIDDGKHVRALVDLLSEDERRELLDLFVDPTDQSIRGQVFAFASVLAGDRLLHQFTIIVRHHHVLEAMDIVSEVETQ